MTRRAINQNGFTHLDGRGQARMVDVSAKPATARLARAQARVLLNGPTLRRLKSGRLPKGDIGALTRVAGILAAKRAAEFVPLAHPLPLSHVAVEIHFEKKGVRLESVVKTVAPTGVELEALMAVWGAAITVYDMVKALQRDARITDVFLLEKSGGRQRFFASTKTR